MPAATHRKSSTRLYAVWKAMRGRCRNPNYSTFARYGGRGIRVCAAWESFPAFEEWALGNGWKTGMEIDRINNDGNYCPENCRITTRLVNNNNSSQCRPIMAFGETKNIAQWFADPRCAVKHYMTLRNRIMRYGWTPERAILQPC